MKLTRFRFNWNIAFYMMVMLASVIIGFLMFLPKLSSKIWPYKSYIVVSESMDPIIHKNDMIVVKKEKDYDIGDIITFSYELDGDGEDYLITHFLASKENGVIKTRSNQSEAFDRWEIGEEDIIGKVRYIVPKIGYLFIPVFNHAVFFLLFSLILVLMMIAKVLLEMKEEKKINTKSPLS